MVKLDITFNRENGVYWAGEVVSGMIHLAIREPIRLNVVTFKVDGRGHIHWSEKWSLGDVNRRLHYAVDRPYLCDTVDMWGKRKPNGDPMPEWMLVGSYEYPFQFQLPSDAATSFEGESEGYVRYFVEVYVDIAMAIDEKLRKHLSVIGLVNLSDTELSSKGGRKKITKEFSGNCFGSGELTIELSIPRLAYVPGEVIPITASIVNDTKNKIHVTRARLFQQTTFRAMLVYDTGADNERRLSRSKKKQVQCTGIPQKQTQQGIPKLIAMIEKTKNIVAGASQHWLQEGMLIPSVTPKQNTCPEIEIGYFLELEVDLGSLLGTYNVQLPLIIGTIPKDTVHMAISDTGNDVMSVRSELRQSVDLEKPAFRMASVNRGRIFVPMYPVYSMSTVAPNRSKTDPMTNGSGAELQGETVEEGYHRSDATAQVSDECRNRPARERRMIATAHQNGFTNHQRNPARVTELQFAQDGKLILDTDYHFMCREQLIKVMENVCNHCYARKRRNIRTKRGIVDQCCIRPCRFIDLTDYCGRPEDCQ